MPDKLFDNFVRDKLGNYPSPVPEGLWDKIVNDKGRRPKGFWWTNNIGMLVAIAIATALTGTFFILNNQKQNPLSNNSTQQTITSAGTGIDQSSRKADTSMSKEDKTLSNLNEDKSATTSGNNDQSITNPITQRLNGNAVSSGFAAIAGGRHSKKISSYAVNNNSNADNSTNTDQNVLNTTVDQMAVVADKKAYSGSLMNSYRNNLYNRNSMYNPPLNLRSILGLGSDCPSANGYQRNDWYLEVYGSPDYTMKSVSGNGLSSAYLQKKDSAEKMRDGFTIGARFAKTVGDHFILKAGLQYSQVNEKFSLRSENQRVTTTVIISRTVVRPQGDTTFNDTTTVTQIGYAVRTSKNRYRNVEIPISLGYEFGDEKDKWKIGLNGGVIINIASSYVGETLDTSLNVVSYNSKSSAGFYNTKVGLSLYGGVSLIRNIHEGLDVFAEPYFRYNLSNVSSSIGYSQRFSAAGLTLGVRMKLNNKRQHL
jgi:hypothetical protein